MENQTQKKKIPVERIFLYAILVTFLFIGLFLTLGLKDAKQCLANPLKYGAEKLQSEYTGELSCFCSFENQELAPFNFNSENISVLPQ